MFRLLKSNRILQPSFFKLDFLNLVRYGSGQCCNAKDMIFRAVCEDKKRKPKAGNKVTVVGAGNVGIACIASILYQGFSNDICLIDVNKDKVKGEVDDFAQGGLFLKNPKIVGSTDFAASAGSRVVVITAGVAQKKGETRLALVKKNADMLKKMVPELVKHSPNTIFVLVTNPVDIMTYATFKLSKFPETRVIGTGTHLDTARFRYFLGKIFGVSPASTHGWIIGEHGDTSLPVWSAVTIGGVRLRDLNEKVGICEDPLKLHKLAHKVRRAAYEVIQNKGFTNWAIGLTTADLVKAIIFNTYEVITVSSLVEDQYCLPKPVFLSLPRVINGNGASSFIQLNIDNHEQKLLQKSAETLQKIEESLQLC